MKTPTSLCITIDVNKAPPEGVSVYLPKLVYPREPQSEQRVGIVVSDRDISQVIIAAKDPLGWLWVCPSCKTFHRKLYLPLYGKEFACAKCWNVGDEPAIKPEPGEGQWAKLLKKFLRVMK